MPKLIILCGTSFAGKTTLARLLTARFGHAEVDVDETKATLFGAAAADEALSRGDWERIYAETDRLIAHHLRAGQSVVDASRNFTKAERRGARGLCQEHHADLLTIHVDTPEHITRQRLLANRQSPTRRDVSDDAFAAILAGWEPPSADECPLIFRWGDDSDEWVARHAAALAEG